MSSELPTDPPPPHGALSDLQARIDKARRDEAARDGSGSTSSQPPSGMAAALRLSTELIAGVAVGCGLGWAFDKGFGTSPIGLVVFMLLGFAAGTMNLIRAAARPKGGTNASKNGPEG